MTYLIEDDYISADSDLEAAVTYACLHAGFDCDEPCYEPFDFDINGTTYLAELVSITGRGTGTIKIYVNGNGYIFDQDGIEH